MDCRFSDNKFKYCIKVKEKNLLILLNKALKEEATDVEKNHLFEIFIEVARYRVRFVSKIKYFSLERNEISMDEIALESVTNLLSNNENDFLEYLRNTFCNWDPPIVKEEDAAYFVSKIIDQSIYQTIARKYSEIDPLFAKILKEIRRADASKFKVFKKLETEFIAYKELKEKKVYNIIPQDELLLLRPESLPNNNYIKGWIEQIFIAIDEFTEYDPILPINSLALKIKFEFTAAQKIDINIFPDPETQIMIKEGILISLNKIERKLKNLQNKKTKYNERLVTLFREAINDIAYDLLEGESIKNYYRYLKKHDKNLSMKDYRENYRAQFEYLIKLLKQEIAHYYLQI